VGGRIIEQQMRGPIDRRRREGRGAEEVGFQEGMPPPQWRRSLRGLLPRNFVILELKNGEICAFWVLFFLQFGCLFYTQINWTDDTIRLFYMRLKADGIQLNLYCTELQIKCNNKEIK